ncbi:tetratricopeptide repeat protein [Nonomuraea sp. NPDC059023]|uniref:tetratricopeptide repeat protein n=1 Tax=unclassified Nonomuraea TaxID=2593643 RepID=UPI0036B5CEA4
MAVPPEGASDTPLSPAAPDTSTSGPLPEGGRSAAIGGDNSGIIVTGDVNLLLTTPAPAPALAGLPAPPADFTGRETALGQLLESLHPARDAATVGTDGAVTASVVAGMAGVGKTALALVAAHRALEAGWFAGGVFFCDLHGYTPGQDVVEADAVAGQVLRAMGLRPEQLPTAGDEVLAVYRSRLAEHAREGRGVLVVADNIAAASQVQALIPAQDCHRLLVTSRNTLPLAGRQFDLDVLAETEAVELLRRALAVRRADVRVDAEPDAAVEVARWCGRLPLAVQIIAALLAVEPDRPLAAMAAELAETRERLDVLHIDGQGADRPWAVRAAFDLCYHRLADRHPARARLFRLMALVPGVDASTTAATVLDGRPEAVVRRDLRELALAHLIARVPAQRWAMHDLMRLYAGEQANRHADQDESLKAVWRLLGSYLQLMAAGDAQLAAVDGQTTEDGFADRAAALAWFDAEHASLVASVGVAHRAGLHAEADCLVGYLSWRRHLHDLLAVCSIAVTCTRETGDREGEGRAIGNLATALRQARRLEEAIAMHSQAVHLFQQLGDRHREAEALGNLGNTLREAQRAGEAISIHIQAAKIFIASGDRHSEAKALNNLGIAVQDVHEWGKAILFHTKAADIFRELGDQRGQSIALSNLGAALQRVGRYEEAITRYERNLTICRELDDQYGEGATSNNLGLALQSARRLAEAITAHEQAAAIFQAIGDEHSLDIARRNLANARRLRDGG